MALSASTVWEVRFTGNNGNGGAFVTGATGTDRSQQDAAHATLTTASTVHTTTTQINVAVGDFTVSAADVGNIYQNTGGSSTAGFYQITAVDVANNRWTVDRSVGTAGQTVAGSMGGALAYPALAGSQTVGGTKVAGNVIWWKYSASTYDVTSTTANIGGGRIAMNAANLRLEGYEVTRGDLSTNRPVLKATVNTFTMFDSTAATGIFGNFNLDRGSATGILPVSTGAGTTTHRVKTLNGANTTANFSCGSGSILILCGANGGSVPGFRMNGSTLLGCVARGQSTFAFESAASHNTCIDCIADSVTGNNPGFTNTGAASRLWCINCTSYGHGATNTAHGFTNPGVAHSLVQVNCIADSNTGTGIGANNASHAFNCIARNNTAANFGANAVQFGSVTLTASPFTSEATHDFSLNNTSGAGADARGAGLPAAFSDIISTTSHPDIGAVQHESTTSTTTTNNLHVLFTLPSMFDLEG